MEPLRRRHTTVRQHRHQNFLLKRGIPKGMADDEDGPVATLRSPSYKNSMCVDGLRVYCLFVPQTQLKLCLSVSGTCGVKHVTVALQEEAIALG